MHEHDCVCGDQSSSGESGVSLRVSASSVFSVADKSRLSWSLFTSRSVSSPSGSSPPSGTSGASSVGVTSSVVVDSFTVASVSVSSVGDPSSSCSSSSFLGSPSSSSSSSSAMEASGLCRECVVGAWLAQGCRCGESEGGSSVSDSTLRESALLSVRREMVGWDAGVRLGASVGAVTEETSVTSPPPPSPSPPEEEGGVCSKNVPSSAGEERRGEERGRWREKAPLC